MNFNNLLASSSAVMALACAVVPLAASPASAAQKKCESQDLRSRDDRYSLTFDFCIEPEGGSAMISIENFKCYVRQFVWDRRTCDSDAGTLVSRLNGSARETNVGPFLHYEGEPYDKAGFWKTSVRGCEEGDLYQAAVEDLRVSFQQSAEGVSFPAPYIQVRC